MGEGWPLLGQLCLFPYCGASYSHLFFPSVLSPLLSSPSFISALVALSLPPRSQCQVEKRMGRRQGLSQECGNGPGGWLQIGQHLRPRSWLECPCHGHSVRYTCSGLGALVEEVGSRNHSRSSPHPTAPRVRIDPTAHVQGQAPQPPIPQPGKRGKAGASADLAAACLGCYSVID